ncbi:hypothetical protein TB2_027082 [Malus domestica]
MGVQENALGDKFTYPFVLKAWARESAIDKGREVHGVVVRVGFIVSLLNLVCEKIESVRQVFDGFTMKDVVFWNTMKMGYARNGMVFEASDGFREMVEMGEEIWVRIVWDMFIGTSLVDLYAKCGSIEATREVFDQKDKKTVATWNAILSG